MMLKSVDVLRCIRCYNKLELDIIKSDKDECIEGFLSCNCSIYPIVDGVAIIIDDLVEYFVGRRSVLGYLIANSDGKMKMYLKTIARLLPKEVYYDRYENNAFNIYKYIDYNFYNKIADIIIENLDSCLEIGCGIGITANKIAEHLDTVIGIDRSFNMIRKARENKNAEFIVADLSALPFKGFDIVSINTLDLFEPDQFIKSVKKSIKDTLILVDPYDFRDEYGDPLSDYNGKIVRSILEKHGFKIDDNTVEEQYIPWKLRMSDRAYITYLADLIIARLA